MEFIADLHIHSKYSRATSRFCDLEHLHYWAQLKGVRVVGTGDCTHPRWREEIRDKLVPANHGLYRLHPSLAKTVDREVPTTCRNDVQFMVTGEISSIYKRDQQVRKIHSLLLLPSLEKADQLAEKLEKIGNLHSDGRPILGLDPRDLLEIMLTIAPGSALVPAHIWTPWFALFGSKSGFDSLNDCFAELSRHIFAVETGLSSDPPMNWRVSQLDRLTLISNSDLHSPGNLGRNASVFRGTPDFPGILEALRQPKLQAFQGTIDMFPEQGKYHADGHRKCGFHCLPGDSANNHHQRCPECGSPLTLGVLHRVCRLADRETGFKPENAAPFKYTIALPLLLSEILQAGETSKKVLSQYHWILQQNGPELAIIHSTEPARLKFAPELRLLPEALERLRNNQVIREPGYDGEYGQVRIFNPAEITADKSRKQQMKNQLSP